LIIINVHSIISIEYIKEGLNEFIVGNFTNALHGLTYKEHILFVVDLEPNLNNKDIFLFKPLCYIKIKVEALNVRNQIPQLKQYIISPISTPVEREYNMQIN
jgi:hypothetical protein